MKTTDGNKSVTVSRVMFRNGIHNYTTPSGEVAAYQR